MNVGTKGHDEFDCRCEEGMWLGVRDETGDIVIGIDERMIKARNFKRLESNEKRWATEAIGKINGATWVPFPGKGEIEIPCNIMHEEKDMPPQCRKDLLKPPIARRYRIKGRASSE